MRVIRWKNAATGVESLNITATGVYFPVGKEDAAFIARYVMASAGQTASVEVVRDSNGSRVGVPGVSVSGTTETISRYKRSLAFGIVVTAISGTLIATLDDEVVRTNWPDNLGRFPAQADLDAYVYGGTGLDGCTATVLGVQYTYGDGGWGAGGWLVPYANYATLSAVTPTLGLIAQIPRLCGNGYFALRGNGTRWEVCPGESIVRDAGVGSAGYNLTSTGTAYVPLVSYTIPAGLIGDGEEWEFDIHAMSLDVHTSGSDYVDTYVGGTKLLGTAPLLSVANQVARKRGAFVRLDKVLAMRAGTTIADLYGAATNNDATVDMSIQQELGAGFSPGAANNKMRLRHFCFRRIG